MFDELNNNNAILFAMKHYNNPQCHTRDDFDEDMRRFKYLKRLFKRYLKNDELRIPLILNHLIIIYNVFGEAATPLLFLYMGKEYWSLMKTFLIYLNKYPIGFLPELDIDGHVSLQLESI